MATEEGRAAARRHVMARMGELGWNPARLATEAAIDYGTAGDFINGKRWPKLATLAKIDASLGWTPGTLAAIGDELQSSPDSKNVSVPSDDGDLLYRTPENLTAAQWERIRVESMEYIRWQIERASQER